MDSEKRSSFLHHNIKLMRTIGLWPLNTESKVLLTLNFLYTVLLAILLALVSICQVIEIFVSPNITSMASAVDLATLTASALFKMVYIIWYREYFQALVDKIDTTFVQNDFFTGTFSMSGWVRNSKTYTNVYVSMGGPMLFFMFGVSPYFMPSHSIVEPFSIQNHQLKDINGNISMFSFDSVEKGNLELNRGSSKQFDRENQKYFLNETLHRENLTERTLNCDREEENVPLFSTERKFPFNCWIPFNVTWSPIYEFIYLLQLVPLIGSGHLYLVSDSFFFMMIYLTCGQLELLKASFRGLQEKFSCLQSEIHLSESTGYKTAKGRPVKSPVLWNCYMQEKQVERKMDEALIKCVDFHNKLIQIIHELDILLRAMVLVDFVHAVISLSFAMLQTVTSNSLLAWAQMIVFILVCILHQFLNNYFGEILWQQQRSVTEAVYESPWVEGSDLHKVTVYMALNQANHPTKLSGWRMYHLGLSTFVEFMKLLASYFLVLQSLHADESRRNK